MFLQRYKEIRTKAVNCTGQTDCFRSVACLMLTYLKLEVHTAFNDGIVDDNAFNEFIRFILFISVILFI